MYPPINDVLPPAQYDWSVLAGKPRGFRKWWCEQHFHSNGQCFNHKTLGCIINGNYVSGAGPRIAEIIKAALAEELISPLVELDEAA